MKKIILVMFTLLMALSVAACGGEADMEESSVNKEQTEVYVSNAEESKDEEAENLANEETPVFDNSWASNDFEKLIPKPPFEGWTGEETSEGVYEMITSQADADDSLAYYDIWEEYISLMTDCGFVLDGDVYETEGFDSKGNAVELKCGDGHAWITIIKAE